MLGRTALLLAHTTLARGLVVRAAVPAVPVSMSTRSSSVCMQAQASRLTVLVPVADDSEEIETSCITDTLTRAGAEVVVASVMPELQVRMSRGLKVGACVDTKAKGAAAVPCFPVPAVCVPYAPEAQDGLPQGALLYVRRPRTKRLIGRGWPKLGAA